MPQDMWQEVTTLIELEAFLNHVGSFHDGIIKEVHWVNRDYVGSDLGMRTTGLAEARMLIQRQWRDPSAVEIAFVDVWKLNLGTLSFVFESSARTEVPPTGFGADGEMLTLDLDGSEIGFRSMRWRDASDWMDESVRFASPS